MKVYRILQAVLSAFTLFAGFGAFAQSQCPPLQDTDKARLADYVQKKYKAPATVRLEVAEAGFLGSTCYRRVQFKAQDPSSGFHVELFATPDLRFLSRELLDSTVDPIEEERKKTEALASGLTRADLPVRGKPGAPVTIAVFSDFQCPYCARFAAIIKEVPAAESDKVRLVFHQLPLPMHAWARPAAEAAACAQEQGTQYFWALHDYMFDQQKDLTRDNLLGKLAEVTKGLAGFDQGRFAVCVMERKTAAQVDEAVAFAQQNGINATPTVFINGQKTQVVAPEQLRTLIQQLNEAPKPPSPSAGPAPAKAKQDR